MATRKADPARSPDEFANRSSICKRRATAGFKVAFDRKAIRQKDFVPRQLDMIVGDGIDFELDDRGIVHQELNRDQHILDEHRVIW